MKPRLLLAVAGLLSAASVLAGQAGAATGDLTFAGCIADDGTNGCASAGSNALGSAFGLALSADGSSVYVASTLSDSITQLQRAPTGELSFAHCISSEPTSSCTQLGSTALNGAMGVAVSSDGTSVYVVSNFANSITHFRRAPTGELTPAGCIASGAIPGCANLGTDVLKAAFGVALSPDGTSVYVTSHSANSITHFHRAPNGDLSYAGCISSGGAHNCTNVGSTALDGARGLALSPDGTSVYVTSEVASSIVHFHRAPSGDLTPAGCIASSAINDCTNIGSNVLNGVAGVAVSPGTGDDVYVTSDTASSISDFRRAPDGALTFASCVANASANGCADGGASIVGARAVAVSADGNSVYVGSRAADSVTHFIRAPGGSLSFGNCVANGGANGCADVGSTVLDGTAGVAISPDDADVYVTSAGAHSVAQLRRELPAGGGGGDGSGATCAGKTATQAGTNSRDVIRGTPRPDVIAALGGNDLVKGLGAGDLLCGGAGRDTLRGGRGRDGLVGGAAPDLLVGGPGHDVLRGGPGKDEQRQ